MPFLTPPTPPRPLGGRSPGPARGGSPSPSGAAPGRAPRPIAPATDPGGRPPEVGPPAPGHRVLLHTYLCSWTGYGRIAERIGRALEALGVPVGYLSAGADEQYLPVDPWVRARVVTEAGPDEGWAVHLQVPPSEVHGGRRTVAFTMWETTGLPPQAVRNMNRCEVVVVPSRWNAECFAAAGVSRPIRVVPLGLSDPWAFTARPAATPVGPVRFGMAGRTRHGRLRKNLDEGILAFLEAFPTEPDVRLALKLWPDCEVDVPGDPRVEVSRVPLAEADLGDWYRGLDALLVPSRGEGWGMHTHEAMACGVPPITALWGGTAEFCDESVCYPLEYLLEPAGESFADQGSWISPTRESMARQLRRVYLDRAGAAEVGRRAAERAREFTWERSARALLDVLLALGAVRPDAVRPDPWPAIVSTVARPDSRLPALVAELGAATLVVGSPETGYLDSLAAAGAPPCLVVAPTPEEYAPLAGLPVHRRAAWNYARCLGQAAGLPRALIVEDDVRFARGWRDHLARRVAEIEATCRDYVLTLYTPGDAYPRGPGAVVPIEPVYFYGTQAMLFPGRVAGPFRDYLLRHAVERPDGTYDLLLGRFCGERGIPMFATSPSLVQHEGHVGTGLGGFHHAADFVDDPVGKGD